MEDLFHLHALLKNNALNWILTRQIYNLFQDPLENFLGFISTGQKGNLKGHLKNKSTGTRIKKVQKIVPKYVVKWIR